MLVSESGSFYQRTIRVVPRFIVNRPAELSYTALRFFITFSLYFNLPTKREKVGIL